MRPASAVAGRAPLFYCSAAVTAARPFWTTCPWGSMPVSRAMLSVPLTRSRNLMLSRRATWKVAPARCCPNRLSISPPLWLARVGGFFSCLISLPPLGGLFICSLISLFDFGLQFGNGGICKSKCTCWLFSICILLWYNRREVIFLGLSMPWKMFFFILTIWPFFLVFGSAFIVVQRFFKNKCVRVMLLVLASVCFTIVSISLYAIIVSAVLRALRL